MRRLLESQTQNNQPEACPCRQPIWDFYSKQTKAKKRPWIRWISEVLDREHHE